MLSDARPSQGPSIHRFWIRQNLLHQSTAALSVSGLIVRICFYCRGIGTRALRCRRSVEFIVLTLVKLTQHPSYDPVLFVEALCIMALVVDCLGLRHCLTIDCQDLVVHCRFADLNIRIGKSYLCLSARGEYIYHCPCTCIRATSQLRQQTIRIAQDSFSSQDCFVLPDSSADDSQFFSERSIALSLVHRDDCQSSPVRTVQDAGRILLWNRCVLEEGAVGPSQFNASLDSKMFSDITGGSRQLFKFPRSCLGLVCINIDSHESTAIGGRRR